MPSIPKCARPVLLLLAVLSVGALALGACGDTKPGDSPTVLATTTVAADIVSRVGGEDVTVETLVPDGSDPHSYAPSAQEQQRLAEADLLVLFSPKLEAALPIDGAERSFAIAGDAEDPHVWLDPTRVAAALPELAAELAEVDPDHADDFERRADRYASELEDLDASLERALSVVPDDSRKLVTSHDSMGYFADRYDFEFVGAAFGIAPEAEASADQVAELIELIEAERVPAVFAAVGDDPEVLERIASEAEVEIVDNLRIESLGDTGSYVEMMRFTAGRIADALAGSQD